MYRIYTVTTADVCDLNSITLIIRDNEVDITMASIRVVILLHQRDGKRFLWPAIRKISENAVPGIMGNQALLIAVLLLLVVVAVVVVVVMIVVYPSHVYTTVVIR